MKHNKHGFCVQKNVWKLPRAINNPDHIQNTMSFFLYCFQPYIQRRSFKMGQHFLGKNDLIIKWWGLYRRYCSMLLTSCDRFSVAYPWMDQETIPYKNPVLMTNCHQHKTTHSSSLRDVLKNIVECLNMILWETVVLWE